MTLESILRRASFGVKSPQVQKELKGYVNDAVRTIAERRNWSFMFDRREVAVPSGFDSAPLGEDFKQLIEEESAVYYKYGNYQLSVQVSTRSRIQLAGIWPFPNGPFSFPVPGGYMPIRVVFLEREAQGQWRLWIPPQFSVTQGAIFGVQGYWYPTPLVKGGDENAMTRDGNLGDAVTKLAQSYAYRAEDPTSEQGEAAKEQAEEAITRAIYSDAAISMKGVNLRM